MAGYQVKNVGGEHRSPSETSRSNFRLSHHSRMPTPTLVLAGRVELSAVAVICRCRTSFVAPIASIPLHRKSSTGRCRRQRCILLLAAVLLGSLSQRSVAEARDITNLIRRRRRGKRQVAAAPGSTHHGGECGLAPVAVRAVDMLGFKVVVMHQNRPYIGAPQRSATASLPNELADIDAALCVTRRSSRSAAAVSGPSKVAASQPGSRATTVRRSLQRGSCGTLDDGADRWMRRRRRRVFDGYGRLSSLAVTGRGSRRYSVRYCHQQRAAQRKRRRRRYRIRDASPALSPHRCASRRRWGGSCRHR